MQVNIPKYGKIDLCMCVCVYASACVMPLSLPVHWNLPLASTSQPTALYCETWALLNIHTQFLPLSSHTKACYGLAQLIQQKHCCLPLVSFGSNLNISCQLQSWKIRKKCINGGYMGFTEFWELDQNCRIPVSQSVHFVTFVQKIKSHFSSYSLDGILPGIICMYVQHLQRCKSCNWKNVNHF